MKILLWPTLYFPNIGGLEKMVHTLALSLQSKGHEIIVMTNAEKTDTFCCEGISVFTFPFITALFSYRLPLIRQILADVSQLCSTFSPDIVHIHGWFECFSFYQIRVLEKQQVPVCLTLHGLLEQKHYQTENCLKLWQRAQAVSTVSHAIVPPEPHPCIQTIHNGLPLSEKPLQPLPKHRLLLIGRLTAEKCFHIAFHALKQILPQYPNLKLILIGNGPDYNMLWQLKCSLDLPIDMPGFVPPDAVQDFIDRSTLILVPSSYESFSLVALETALRGRPVIASNVLGLKEVIEDQKTGLLIEPQNPDILAAAIDRLLSQPQKLEQMGQAAFERASRLFTIENTTNKYLKLYEHAAHFCNYSCS